MVTICELHGHYVEDVGDKEEEKSWAAFNYLEDIIKVFVKFLEAMGVVGDLTNALIIRMGKVEDVISWVKFLRIF